MKLPIDITQGAPPRVTIDEVRDAVTGFLMKQPEIREAHVTKLVPIDAAKGSWEAEAEVFVLNAVVKGLPVEREVLDSSLYLLRLDGREVVAYGPKDSVAERGTNE